MSMMLEWPLLGSMVNITPAVWAKPCSELPLPSTHQGDWTFVCRVQKSAVGPKRRKHSWTALITSETLCMLGRISAGQQSWHRHHPQLRCLNARWRSRKTKVRIRLRDCQNNLVRKQSIKNQLLMTRIRCKLYGCPWHPNHRVALQSSDEDQLAYWNIDRHRS